MLSYITYSCLEFPIHGIASLITLKITQNNSKFWKVSSNEYFSLNIFQNILMLERYQWNSQSILGFYRLE